MEMGGVSVINLERNMEDYGYYETINDIGYVMTGELTIPKIAVYISEEGIGEE